MNNKTRRKDHEIIEIFPKVKCLAEYHDAIGRLVGGGLISPERS